MNASSHSDDAAFRAIDEAMALVNPNLPCPPRPAVPPGTDDALSVWYAVSGNCSAQEAPPDVSPRAREAKGAPEAGRAWQAAREASGAGEAAGAREAPSPGAGAREAPSPGAGAREAPSPGAGAREAPRSRENQPENQPENNRPEPGPGCRRGLPWAEARRVARTAGEALGSVRRSLREALGHALAEPLRALTDLPSFDTSAMDGWAVAGPGPWRLSGQVLAGQVLAGERWERWERAAQRLSGGRAVGIATGAALPPGATAVLRREHGRIDDADTLHSTVGAVPPGQDVRPRAQECRAGDELLGRGTVVTPAVLGLAAAAGYDELTVVRRPRVEVLVLGDELLDRGLPTAGRVRDALGPLLPPWLSALGADVTAVRRLVDDADMLNEAVRGCDADVIVTSGGTAGGPVDFVHPVLDRIGAKMLVDGVAVRPGHPMLLAALPSGGHLVGLPGNPLAAVSGVLTLAEPLLRALAGRPAAVPYAAELSAEVSGHPTDTRLIPVAFDEQSRAVPLHFTGPAMLRGLAVADGMAVIPPSSGAAPRETVVLGTAWGSDG